MSYFIISAVVFFLLCVGMIVMFKLDVIDDYFGYVVMAILSLVFSAAWVVCVPIALIGGVAYLAATGIVKVIKHRKEKKV